MERCYLCRAIALTDNVGVIYVRANINGRWQSAPICRPCWDLHYAQDVAGPARPDQDARGGR